VDRTHFRRTPVADVVEQLALPLAIGLFFFVLQVRHLDVAAYPVTDEGVYAEVGRMIVMRGLVPHRDFPMGHMPLLPLLIGLGLRAFGSMYVLRTAFLLLNCLCVVPLYLAFVRLRDNSAAATLALLFFLTFYAMVHHDYRFIAIRQLANVILICFLYLGVCRKGWRWRLPLQTACSLASVFLFLPTAIHLALVSLAMVALEQGSNRRAELRRYFAMGLICLAALGAYFLVIPEAVTQTILDQARRANVPRLDRIRSLWEAHPDAILYVIACPSLALGILFAPGLRAMSAAMLGIFATSLLLSSNFFPHYVAAAGPALAFGIFVFGDLVDRAGRMLGSYGFVAARAVQALAFAWHATLVLAPLSQEWAYDRKPEYYELVDHLTDAPDPLLTIGTIYAVESGRTLLTDAYPAYMRGKVERCTPAACDAMAANACTILLEQSGNAVFPPKVQRDWMKRFTVLYRNDLGTILLTNHPGCR
jgi:hypothetical protein